MTYFSLGHRLPSALSIPLFGDRKRFGPIPDESDASWREWHERDLEFYTVNQRSSVGLTVNKAGYRIVSAADLTDRDVLEIGPGDVAHIEHWRGRPRRWVNFDIRENLLEIAAAKIEATGVPHEEVLAESDSMSLPFPEASFDAVFTFYALEHIHPLDKHLGEIVRVLRPGGLLIGGIPCEGGLAWGAGRYMTSRRWLLRNTTIDPSRLICWEHPNFAENILNALNRTFERQTVRFWPLVVPIIDINLVASFVYRRRAD